MSDTFTIKNDGEEQDVMMEDISGVDMSEVQEFDGFESFAKGKFNWHVKDAGLDTVETKNGNRGTIYFDLECTGVHAVVDDEVDPNSLIGNTHRETIFIHDVAKSLGQAKAIMTRSGFTGKGSLEELLDQFCGHEFTAPIKQRKDKNDADVVYANIVVKKITPLEAVA